MQIEIQQFENKIFFVDMDNTLIYSDTANNWAYQQAICQCVPNFDLHLLINSHSSNRLTENSLKQWFSVSDLGKIVSIKQKTTLYKDYWTKTQINQSLLNFLEQQSSQIYLVTNSQVQRAKALLQFYMINHLFTDFIFSKGQENKYQYALNQLNLQPNQVIVFEDDDEKIIEAVQAGIPDSQIIKI